MGLLRLLVRLIGWLLVLAALALLAREAAGWWRAGDWQVVPAGKLWFDLHRTSLQLAQPAIERHVWPFLWNPVILTVLQWPAWAVIGVPGLILALTRRPRRGPRPSRRIFGSRR